MSDLPDGWELSTVAEVGRLQLGRQRAPQYHSGPNMKPYLRVANVFEDRIDTRDVKQMNFEPDEFERFRLHPGDVLLNEGQTPELLGRPAIYRGQPQECAFTNSLIRFQAGPRVLPEWALIVFRAHMHSGRFTRESRITTNIAHLSLARLRGVAFPVPPLDEQHRIVTVLEDHLSRIDAGAGYLDAAARRSRSAEQALIDELFVEEVEARRWPRLELATFATGQRAITDGPFGSNLTSAHYAPDGALVVRLQNIGDGIFKEAEAFIPLAHYEALRVHDVRQGDVVIASLGDDLPRAAVVPELGGPAIVKADCIRVRPDDDVDPRWLVYACRSRIAKRHAAALVRGVGRQRLGLKGIRSIPVPRLPRAEQERHLADLEERLFEVSRLRDASHRAKAHRFVLQQSLLSAAVSGRL
jgi:hypothetical protein